MIDYSHIPLQVKLTERWKIDPEYDAAKYYRSMNRRGTGNKNICHPATAGRDWPKVPELVLAHALEMKQRGERTSVAIAAVCKVDFHDFRNEMNAYAGGYRRPAPKYEEMTEGEILKDEWLVSQC